MKWVSGSRLHHKASLWIMIRLSEQGTVRGDDNVMPTCHLSHIDMDNGSCVMGEKSTCSAKDLRAYITIFCLFCAGHDTHEHSRFREWCICRSGKKIGCMNILKC